MDKKAIYEHLAKIYLDASGKKEKKSRNYLKYKNIIFVALVVFTVTFTYFLSNYFLGNAKLKNSEIALILSPDAVKINFHFDPARKETYSLSLNKLNAARFKTLRFSAKNVDYQDAVTLRVEFTNIFKEKSEIYIKDISHKWQDYRIGLSDFKKISDWSEMTGLTFVVEEWNVRGKKGIVYLDNIRLID
jgi:hypothetical protein